jgi:hypothetical protein
MTPFDVEITTDDPAIAALCCDYWAIDDDLKFPVKVADLAERYHLKPHDVARVVRDSSVVRSSETRCAGCDQGMEFASRADFQQRRSWHRNLNRPFVCERCARESAQIRAREAEEREARQRAAVVEWFALAEGGSLDIDEFDLDQALGLLSVIRTGATEDLTEIVPAESWSSPLAPTADLDSDVIKGLFESRILAISEKSPVDAFEWDELDPARFFRMKVGWHITDGAGAAVPIAVRQATWSGDSASANGRIIGTTTSKPSGSSSRFTSVSGTWTSASPTMDSRSGSARRPSPSSRMRCTTSRLGRSTTSSGAPSGTLPPTTCEAVLGSSRPRIPWCAPSSAPRSTL